MRSNDDIIKKADLAVSDLTSDGGKLNPEQEARFIRKLINAPTLLRQVRTVEMASPTRNINKIQFNKRILRAGTSGTALSTAADAAGTALDTSAAGQLKRAKVQTSQVVLTTKEVIAEVRLPYDVIEDNIERGNVGRQTDVGGSGAGGGLIDTILELMAERAALDLEELAILGDTGSADEYLVMTDGFIKEIETNGNTVDVANATLTKEVFKNGMKTMPDPYLRNLAGMRHYVSIDNEIEWRDTVANRGTGLGDSATSGGASQTAYGVPVEGVALMPAAKGIFTNPLNLIMGIQRAVMMEWDKDISTRELKIVITSRLDFQVEESEGAVVYNNIGS